MHERRHAVAGRRHVGVVDLTVVEVVLGLDDERIPLLTAAAVVGPLRVAGRLVEARVVEPIVHPVGHVERLDHACELLCLVRHRVQTKVIAVVEAPWARGPSPQVPHDEPVGGSVRYKHVGVVAAGPVGARGEPGVGQIGGVVVEALHRDECGGDGRRPRSARGRVGRIGRRVLEGVIPWPLVAGLVRPHAVREGVMAGQVLALERPPIVGGNEVAPSLPALIASPPAIELDEEGTDEPLAVGEVDLLHSRRTEELGLAGGRELIAAVVGVGKSHDRELGRIDVEGQRDRESSGEGSLRCDHERLAAAARRSYGMELP